MEGPQPQKETARADSLTDNLGRMMDLFWILGGIVFIVLSAFILRGFSDALYRFPNPLLRAYFAEVAFFISFLFSLGVAALSLAVVYLILPVNMCKMRDALVRGAGLVFLVYPFVAVTATYQYDPLVADSIGMETLGWFLYSVFGLLLLAEPRMKRSDHLREDPHPVRTPREFCIGLLTMALTLFLASEEVVTGMYPFVLVTASSVVVVFTIMYAIHTREPTVKSASLQVLNVTGTTVAGVS